MHEQTETHDITHALWLMIDDWWPMIHDIWLLTHDLCIGPDLTKIVPDYRVTGEMYIFLRNLFWCQEPLKSQNFACKMYFTIEHFSL